MSKRPTSHRGRTIPAKSSDGTTARGSVTSCPDMRLPVNERPVGVQPGLERRSDVLAPTRPGHAGGEAITADMGIGVFVDAVERCMDAARVETAHLVGNSLGGYLALQLAARGRARSVVAFAPAGGWAREDDALKERLDYFVSMQELVKAAAPYAESILSSPEGRRRSTQDITTNFE